MLANWSMITGKVGRGRSRLFHLRALTRLLFPSAFFRQLASIELMRIGRACDIFVRKRKVFPSSSADKWHGDGRAEVKPAKSGLGPLPKLNGHRHAAGCEGPPWATVRRTHGEFPHGYDSCRTRAVPALTFSAIRAAIRRLAHHEPRVDPKRPFGIVQKLSRACEKSSLA